ncbi:dienelactone hydrolase [Pedobacter yulinensis]|uniref:Dienelactone hydrolase n=1 Tax=Pedobacter yulinensis TaxID=2126353 RepID=A0A2T3HQY4_9SPHI|nr:dienelactone hydrolase family protein [Pedobacter yulinensis]PST84852.1 dienelactone hydrolase [Pedobacter yulinensis]
MKTILITLMLGCTALVAGAQLKAVPYQDGPQRLQGLAGKPDRPGNKAGILILPAWFGIDAHCKETAMRLNKLGYHTFIADIYGEGNYPSTAKQAGEISGRYKKNMEDYRRRIRLALDQLVRSGASKERLVVIGYCFGGLGAIEVARRNYPVKGIVSFHGGLIRDASKPIEPIGPKLLVCHGADDPYESEAEIRAFQDEMKQAKADWQMVYYGNAVHSFTEKAAGNDNSKGAAYNETADRRSWQHMRLFLDEVCPAR